MTGIQPAKLLVDFLFLGVIAAKFIGAAVQQGQRLRNDRGLFPFLQFATFDFVSQFHQDGVSDGFVLGGEKNVGELNVTVEAAAARAFVADYFAMVGDKLTATIELDKALKLAPQDPDVLFRASIVYNQLGDDRQTLDWLKKAIAASFSRTSVRDTPDFDHLKSNPAFQAIIAGGL